MPVSPWISTGTSLRLDDLDALEDIADLLGRADDLAEIRLLAQPAFQRDRPHQAPAPGDERRNQSDQLRRIHRLRNPVESPLLDRVGHVLRLAPIRQDHHRQRRINAPQRLQNRQRLGRVVHVHQRQGVTMLAEERLRFGLRPGRLDAKTARAQRARQTREILSLAGYDEYEGLLGRCHRSLQWA